MAGKLDYDLDRVFDFVKGRVPGLARSDDMVAIGWERDGQIVAGAVYEAQDAPMDWVAEDLAAGDSRALDGYVVVMSGEVEVDGVARYPGFVGAAASVAALTPARIVVIQGEPEPT